MRKLVVTKIFMPFRAWLISPVDAASIAVFRMLIGSYCVLWFLCLAGSLRTFYTNDGLFSVADYAGYTNGTAPSVLSAGATAAPAMFVSLLGIVASFLVIIGCWPRVSSLIVYLAVFALYNRGLMIMEGEDHVLLCLLWVMIFVPSAAALSVDRVRLEAKGRVFPARLSSWAYRLVQLQVVLVYADALLGKIQGSHWIDGSAAWYVLNSYRWHFLPVPFQSTLLLSVVLSYGTLAVECGLAVCLWIRRFRAWAVACGFALHLGMFWTMNLGPFPLLMIVALTSYCSSSDWRKLRWLAFKGREYVRYYRHYFAVNRRAGGLRAAWRFSLGYGHTQKLGTRSSDRAAVSVPNTNRLRYYND